jgi:heme-degrading monooxygenase HmoA
MLVRIVKMSFAEENIDTFSLLFNSKKEYIRNFLGCRLLELYRDKTHTNIFFTYSYWDSEADLENYRNSELFAAVWSQTKVLFNEKPQSWSVEKMISLD